MDDDLTIEVDDETYLAIKRMADARGLAVGDMARLLLVEALADEQAAPSLRDTP